MLESVFLEEGGEEGVESGKEGHIAGEWVDRRIEGWKAAWQQWLGEKL